MVETDRQDIVKIITEIVSTVTNMHLYPPTHPQVARLLIAFTKVSDDT